MKLIALILIFTCNSCFAQKLIEQLPLYAFKSESIQQEFGVLLQELKRQWVYNDCPFIVLNEIETSESDTLYYLSCGDKLLAGHTVWGILMLEESTFLLAGSKPFWVIKLNDTFPFEIYDPKDEIIEIVEELGVFVRLINGRLEILR